MNPAYDELCSVWTRLYRFGHLQALADWDRAAMMPAHSHTARASAMAEMDGLMHGLRTDPRLSALLARADAEQLDAFQCANLRNPPRLAGFECLVGSTHRSAFACRCALRTRLAQPAPRE